MSKLNFSHRSYWYAILSNEQIALIKLNLPQKQVLQMLRVLYAKFSDNWNLNGKQIENILKEPVLKGQKYFLSETQREAFLEVNSDLGVRFTFDENNRIPFVQDIESIHVLRPSEYTQAPESSSNWARVIKPALTRAKKMIVSNHNKLMAIRQESQAGNFSHDACASC